MQKLAIILFVSMCVAVCLARPATTEQDSNNNVQCKLDTKEDVKIYFKI